MGKAAWGEAFELAEKNLDETGAKSTIKLKPTSGLLRLGVNGYRTSLEPASVDQDVVVLDSETKAKGFERSVQRSSPCRRAERPSPRAASHAELCLLKSGTPAA